MTKNCGCGHPLWASISKARGYCEGCRLHPCTLCRRPGAYYAYGDDVGVDLLCFDCSMAGGDYPRPYPRTFPYQLPPGYESPPPRNTPKPRD